MNQPVSRRPANPAVAAADGLEVVLARPLSLRYSAGPPLRLAEPRIRLFDRLRCGEATVHKLTAELERQRSAGRLELVKLDVAAQPEFAARLGIQIASPPWPSSAAASPSPASSARRRKGDRRFFDQHVLAHSPSSRFRREDVR